MKDFTGCKAALYFNDKIVVSLRDRKPDLNCANRWDLPGGEREGQETPIECIQREIYEEFGVRLNPDSFVWSEECPSIADQHGRAYFFVARIDDEALAAISFGDEGQGWKLMDPAEFAAHENAVPHLQARLADYLATIN